MNVSFNQQPQSLETERTKITNQEVFEEKNELEIDLEKRIQNPEMFTTGERDQKVAISAYNQLKRKFKNREISQLKYDCGLNSLNLLIPKINEDGTKSIGDIKVTPAIKGLIDSRLQSPEIDITGSEGV